MRRDAFEFLRRRIHFAENDQRKNQGKNQGEPGYDPLFKVRYVLDEIGKGLIKVWHAGKNLSLDESMIKYCDYISANNCPMNMIHVLKRIANTSVNTFSLAIMSIRPLF